LREDPKNCTPYCIPGLYVSTR